jgi:translation initiation factor IF-2
VVTQEPAGKPPTGPGGPDDRGPRPGPGTGPGPGGPGRGSARPAEEDDKPKRSPGEVAGRDSRTKHRNRDRGGKGPTDKGSIIIGAGGQVDLIEQAAGSRKGPRAALLAKLKRQKQQQAVKKEGPVEIALPITVRSLSEAIGMKVGELSKQLLKETAQLYGANSVIAFDVAELIAIGKGITLVAKKVETREDLLLRRFKEQAELVEEEKLRPRPPIVTIMGHVDHGKTSLLDKIRQEYGLASDVVSTEAGGITQVIRAWRVEKDGKPTTFLDTPGHEAFTKMRARGAKVTDIAVIVVAATDGVMPQTEEAIAHAKAADVDIIVAINKVDMPNANLDKTRRQLYSLELLPDNMGGDVPFVETSAITGQGVGELLDAISIMAELAELKADPEHKPSGTCLEAYKEEGRGVVASLIVQQGTLREGDIILCGSTFGRVRAMYDDLGRAIKEAGPSTPVKVLGLDDVPDADDPFYYVNDLAEAREIAEARKERQVEAARTNMAPKSLDAMKEANARAKITELKVVLKAEARGSVEAIKKELEKLIHDEVRCRVLHAGIGAINESDVILALTSPADTLIIGFNVTADDTALRIAEARNISIREYDIIYKLTDDVKAALEGRLKPVEEVVHLGRAVVRETFKITKVGAIAGCYVTSGVIERSARIRVIREGTVIYPPSDRTLGLDSLKRFKDDAKEVREGFECGLKITGFDDVKVGDVIEAFRIEIRHRTL